MKDKRISNFLDEFNQHKKVVSALNDVFTFNKTPSMVYKTLDFNKRNPEDVIYVITMSNGNKALFSFVESTETNFYGVIFYVNTPFDKEDESSVVNNPLTKSYINLNENTVSFKAKLKSGDFLAKEVEYK